MSLFNYFLTLLITLRLKAPITNHFSTSKEKTNMRFCVYLIQLDKERHPNMKVKVHYLGLVKTYTNRTQEDLVLGEDATLGSLLEKLAATFGKPFDHEVYDTANKEVKPMFMVLVNGVVVGQLDGVNTKLENGDNVMLMPLMTGG